MQINDLIKFGTARYILWLCNTGKPMRSIPAEAKHERDKMTELAALLTDLRRPKILIRAARAGVTDYRRDRDLKRLVRDARGATPHDAMEPLLAEENRLEANRTNGGATYNIQRHVAVLTAILAEARRAAPAAPVLH